MLGIGVARAFGGDQPTQHTLHVIGVVRNLVAIDGVPEPELCRDLRLE
jgi:hypothetical protein